MKNNTDRNHRDDVSMTSETSIQDQRPYIMRDLHSDLLDEIKKGNTIHEILALVVFII
jgi:hypothetical protein